MELFHTHVSEAAKVLCRGILDSGRLSEGEFVRLFEKKLTEELGLANPVATNSGTSALHLGLILAGVKPGDEVILPAQTFVATGMAVLHCGAKPVFADIDPRTGNIDPEDVRKRVNGWTQAIVPVAWAGLPPDLDELMVIADKAKVVLDAAHALGATYKGSWLSYCAPFTMFSFQASKQLTCGDGGALCCIDAEDAKRAKRLRWFGIDRDLPPGPLGEREFDIEEVGFKYHMNDVAAAIGLGNLVGFKERLRKRESNARFLWNSLCGTDGMEPICHFLNNRTSAHYCFSTLVERRADFAKAMRSRGVPCSVVCSRIDRLKVFGGRRDDLPGTDEFDAKHIAICSHEALTDGDLGVIVDAVKKGW